MARFSIFPLIVLIVACFTTPFYPAYAQDATFGPICDNVTVICSPTVAPTSVPTSAPQPTSSGGGTLPTATRAPTATPRVLISAGILDGLNLFLLASTLLVITGGLAGISLLKVKD